MRNQDLDFDQEEYSSRIANVRQEMFARKIDVLVIDQFEHLVYLFGFLPTAAKYQACLLPIEGDPHMIVRAMDRYVFTCQSWVTSWNEFADAEDPIALLCSEVRKKYGESLSIGLELDSHILTVERYLQIQRSLPNSRLVDFSGAVTKRRLVKSQAELAYLRQAAEIADACMTSATKTARAGLPEREVAAAVYSVAMRSGADNGRVMLSASGKQTDSIHGRLGARTLENGDVLHLEMVPQVRGYSARVMRPVFIGEPTPSAVHLAERLIDIQNQQIEAMKPGRTGAEIDDIARGQILTELDESFSNHTGYTLGYHAQPRTSEHTRIFVPSADWLLEPGMVFHMFMAIRGIAFGETIVVTESGHERLTHTKRQMFFC